MYSEETAHDYATRGAAEAAARQHTQLLQLAAARTRQAAQRMVERDRARQSRAMKPYVLPQGALVHVSFLHSPTARGLLKSAFHKHMLRTTRKSATASRTCRWRPTHAARMCARPP